MLRLLGKQVDLQEFSEDNLRDPRYFSWLRDLDIITPIYRMEYFMPIQMAEIEKYVRGLFESKRDCFFAIYLKDTQDFIGTVKVGHIDWRTGLADIGIVIGEKSCWGRGLAVDALTVACRYSFGKLSLRKLTGGTSITNGAMRKCFEKVGFRQEALLRKNLLIDGEYVDHCIYGMFRDEFHEE